VKAVLDSSVLVSAFLTPGGSPGRVLAAGLGGRFEAVLSEAILSETARSLRNRPGLAARYGYTDVEAARYAADLAAAVTVLDELRAIAPVCRDPADDHVLAAALTAGAGFIVSGDRDLLELGTHEGVRILAPRPFLDLLAPDRSTP
jgi:putative PIN family toxin of toxin-antitoxin system